MVDERRYQMQRKASELRPSIVKLERLLGHNLNITIKILPSVTDLINGKVTLSDIHEIELEDLLGRSPVKIDIKVIKDFIQNKKVLITGAGGSIGSELAKSILQFNPETLIVFDIDETDIFHLVNNLEFSSKEIIPVIGDIKHEHFRGSPSCS